MQLVRSIFSKGGLFPVTRLALDGQSFLNAVIPVNERSSLHLTYYILARVSKW